MNRSHIDLKMFDHVREVMHCLAGDLWSKTLFSFSTDGSSNMADRLQATVTRFEEQALPSFFESSVLLTSSAQSSNILCKTFRRNLLANNSCALSRTNGVKFF